jgi:MFS family permease
VLFGAVAGVFADRWDRKRTMIAADLLLAAGLLPLLLVRGSAQIWIVLAVLGYVVAGLAMLVWLNEEPGEPADADADALSQGEPALAAADG